MNYLEEKILREGVIRPGNILKIDNFLNHQIQIDVMRFIAYVGRNSVSSIGQNQSLTSLLN